MKSLAMTKTAKDILNTLTNTPRPLYEIAREIRKDWKTINFAATPYLYAMEWCDSINGYYMADSASSIVVYFLSNASSWHGQVAMRVKKELRTMLKNHTEVLLCK